MSDDKSLATVVNSALLEQICKISDEINELTEEELITEIKPNRNLKRLRARFNHERNMAQFEGRKISISTVCDGVIHPNYWTRLVADEKKLAYVTRPLALIQEELQVLQSDFMEGLRKIAGEDPTNLPAGMKVGEWLTAVKMVIDRTAPIIQKVHNLNESRNSKNEKPKEIEDITERIKKLEADLAKKDRK